MATMAEIDPGLMQLFERIDGAPRPRSTALSGLLEAWTTARGDLVAPSSATIIGVARNSFADTAFVFRKTEGKDEDFVLSLGRDAVQQLLGPSDLSMLLSKASFRRGAVRFRRLFEMVAQTGEPILAEFTSASPAGGTLAVEMLVAPLSDDGEHIDALVGGIATRQAAGLAHGRHPKTREAGAEPLVFAFDRDTDFGGQIADHLGLPLSPLEEREFEDGEHKTRPLTGVRGRDTYVVASLHGNDGESVNDRLCRLLFFIGALKTNGAARVTAVTPYLCYLRKDQQTKPRDPLTARYVAQILEAVGADQLITMEAHNVTAFQNAFRIPTLHLDAYDAFASHFIEKIGDAEVTVVSPDLGGGRRADAFRIRLETLLGRPVGKAFMEKQRSMGKVSGELFAGDVAERVAIVMDDMISSGTTMARVSEACITRGARAVYLAATHGLFAPDATDRLSNPAITEISITDTVASVRIAGDLRSRLSIIGVAGIFADAIARSHAGRVQD